MLVPNSKIELLESWLEMAIATMMPIMPIVFMMEVTVVEPALIQKIV
jgi:hypothetical protein